MTATSRHFENKNAHRDEHVAFWNAHIIFTLIPAWFSPIITIKNFKKRKVSQVLSQLIFLKGPALSLGLKGWLVWECPSPRALPYTNGLLRPTNGIIKSKKVVLCKSISSGARYVILHSKIRWRKSNLCRFGSGKWFWLRIIVQVALAGKTLSNNVRLRKRV
jgi:hypothetical protein